MNNIVLFGLKNSGKTSVGKALAKDLKKDFFDLDLLIEKIHLKENKNMLSCREIHKNFGNTYFREIEKKALLSLKGTKNSIISLGGGTAEDLCSHEFIQSLGNLVYLNISFMTFFSRLMVEASYSEIPHYLDEKDPQTSIKHIYEKRTEAFSLLPSLTIHTKDLSIEEIAKEIINALK